MAMATASIVGRPASPAIGPWSHVDATRRPDPIEIGPRSHGVPRAKYLRFQAYRTNRERPNQYPLGSYPTVKIRPTAVALVCVSLLASGIEPAEAQERVRLMGWVQWVSSTRMVVATGAGSIPIDLQQADQDSYQGLRAGDRVIVDGVVADDRSRVIADNIWRAGGGGGSDIQTP